MAYEVPTPKYLRVLNGIRERIEDETYGPGTALPSESQLVAEFGVSRPTVLRALGILRQDGWIESRQGRGHFVRGRPPVGRTSPAYAREALDVDESTQVEILHVGAVMAGPEVAHALQLGDAEPVYERRRRTLGESGPVDLVATYVPVDIGVGTDIPKPQLMTGGLLEHIEVRKGVRGDYAHEWLSARLPTADEAKVLHIDRDDPVITVLIAVYEASGTPVVATLLVMPGSRHEIEDTYPLR